MQMKGMFSLKAGQIVTEKYLRQVLVTSICGILLCMSCLIGTTWAWYAVSIENNDNEIHIATQPPAVEVTRNGSSIALSEPNLLADTHVLEITHSGAVDDVQQKSKLYVTFSVDQIVQGYVILDKDNGYRTSIEIVAVQDCFLSWTVSWFAPDGANPLINNHIELIAERESEPTDEPTATTEDPSTSTEDETKPTETEATEETTKPTETEATEETTKPTETESPEETTESTDTQTDPNEESYQVTESETASTEDATPPTEIETIADEVTIPTELATSATENDT